MEKKLQCLIKKIHENQVESIKILNGVIVGLKQELSVETAIKVDTQKDTNDPRGFMIRGVVHGTVDIDAQRCKDAISILAHSNTQDNVATLVSFCVLNAFDIRGITAYIASDPSHGIGTPAFGVGDNVSAESIENALEFAASNDPLKIGFVTYPYSQYHNVSLDIKYNKEDGVYFITACPDDTNDVMILSDKKFYPYAQMYNALSIDSENGIQLVPELSFSWSYL